jgi:glycerate 2-kinase
MTPDRSTAHQVGDSTRRELLEVFQAALAAVHGRTVVRTRLQDEAIGAAVYVVAVGKAACAMVLGAQDALGDSVRDALVVTKEGYAEPLPWSVFEAGHPYPDARSLAAGAKLLEFAAHIPREAPLLVLLSGGASALVEVLAPGVSLAQLDEINRWLLGAGLDIATMNRIRKRLSRIKGGRLATLLGSRPVLCLAISDVPGDDPRAIGSGPLVADASLQQPLNVAPLPAFMSAALRNSPPAPAAADPCFRNVRLEIVAALDDAKRAAERAARARGWETKIEPAFVSGDAMAAGTRLAQELTSSAHGVVHIWGGETTVHLPPAPGRGGRNQNLALAAARVLAGNDEAVFLAAGTDGTDGPTPDAGAIVDGGTIARGTDAGYDADMALARADAGTFLEASGDLLQTGATGTNVMDLMLGLIP